MTQPFDPLAYLTLAHELAGQSGPGAEARLRAAVGRAYYAVFLVARGKTGVTGRKIHENVVKEIKKLKGYRSAGDKLDRLRRLRVLADYHLLPTDTEDQDWSVNWQSANQIINDILYRIQKI